MSDALIVILVLGIYFSPVFYQLVIVIGESKKGNKLPLRRFKKILKYSFLVLLPVGIAFIILIKVNFLDYEGPINYEKVDQITFENFRGLEFFKKSLYGNERFAYIVTTIESEIEEDSIYVEALFHPSRSFVYNSHSNSHELLTHEIYHFKITELFARKTRQKLALLKKPSKNEIHKIILTTLREERKFQKKYDYDTFHSYVFSKQKEYEKTIDSLLNLFSEYKKPKVPING
ncbi:hypothetical protein [Ulvibacterium marinum]|uniref:DUF922 domain-containing protein n=1 Tax=Ulvibacterium marinum TaxID=2419782 RepID=A0A3B0CEG4_9FLAO|nr:hypothetical protein [Ulvibacterium marinum]RKN81416.1 hypothetical protein D7Z94_10855 [Ulvibacterium marinum]